MISIFIFNVQMYLKVKISPKIMHALQKIKNEMNFGGRKKQTLDIFFI